MDKNILTKVKQFSDIVKQDFIPEKIMLFGSYSRNEQTKDSDIDIAVIFNNFRGDILETESDLWLKAWKIDSRIEPILLDMQDDKSGFCEEIMKTGIEL